MVLMKELQSLELTLCTSNDGKRREFSRILGIPLLMIQLSLEEVQDIDTEIVCRKKAQGAFSILKRPLIVDDTGFGLEALNGFPGALVSWAINAGGNEVLFRMLPAKSSSAAIITTSVGFAYRNEVEIFSGVLKGSVVKESRGDGGFGFDSVFIPDGYSKTFAELSDEEKDLISPRALVLARLKEYLQEKGLTG
jgi:XTP/dITP diphosphohydrolase